MSKYWFEVCVKWSLPRDLAIYVSGRGAEPRSRHKGALFVNHRRPTGSATTSFLHTLAMYSYILFEKFMARLIFIWDKLGTRRSRTLFLADPARCCCQRPAFNFQLLFMFLGVKPVGINGLHVVNIPHTYSYLIIHDFRLLFVFKRFRSLGFF